MEGAEGRSGNVDVPEIRITGPPAHHADDVIRYARSSEGGCAADAEGVCIEGGMCGEDRAEDVDDVGAREERAIREEEER